MRLMTSSLSVDFAKVYTGADVLWEVKTLSDWAPFARRQSLGDRASWQCAGGEAGSAGRSGSSGRGGLRGELPSHIGGQARPGADKLSNESETLPGGPRY